jgi:hypothetical protein
MMISRRYRLIAEKDQRKEKQTTTAERLRSECFAYLEHQERLINNKEGVENRRKEAVGGLEGQDPLTC